MRTAALLALVVATFACGAEPAPRPASDAASAPDASEAALDAPDPCAGVSCLPGSVCSFGACILAPVDASAPDAPAEAGVDGGSDASASADVDPRCAHLDVAGAAWLYCMIAPGQVGCADTANSVAHCGACNNPCPAGADCVGGRCLIPAADAGRD